VGHRAAAVSAVTSESDRIARMTGVAASAWGALLLTVGPDVWYVVDGRRPGAGDEAAVRFLGARHLVQGVVQAAMPSRFQRLYIAIDLAHAVSMGWIAAVDARCRRPAVVSGAAALGAAALTLAARAARR
jgi:hypothetical protein